ncbi:MAG: hypothetical protein O3A20_05240 [Planctomycetota bacterium]|nr:hypothetical protein [Planctomycetota bacterium]
MDIKILLLAAPFLALGACSGTVGDDLAAEEMVQYRTVSYGISGMT